MKNIHKKKVSKDPMAKARKDKNFSRYAEEADLRIRLAVEIYNNRKEKEISQQQLAKMVCTTQKVISNMENADVNIGLALLYRTGESLQFTAQNWSRIFNFNIPLEILFSSNQTANEKNELSSQNAEYCIIR